MSPLQSFRSEVGLSPVTSAGMVVPSSRFKGSVPLSHVQNSAKCVWTSTCSGQTASEDNAFRIGTGLWAKSDTTSFVGLICGEVLAWVCKVIAII